MLKAPLSGPQGRAGGRKPRVTMAKAPPPDAFAQSDYRQPPAYAAYEQAAAGTAYYHTDEGGQRPPQRPARASSAAYRPTSNGRPNKKKHPFISALVALIALLMIAAAAYFMLPIVLNGDKAPYTFANGYILKRNDYNVNFDYLKQYTAPYLEQGLILPGIYIDNVHMGGQTVEQARQMLTQSGDAAKENFKVTVNIGNRSWPFDSSRVPLERNLDAVLEKAYAYGRQSVYGAGKTPYQQRLEAARQLRDTAEGHVNLTTDVTYDKAAVRELTDAIAGFVNRPAQDAQVTGFDFVRKTFSFSDEQDGAVIDADQLYNEVIAKLDERDPNAVLTYEPTRVAPQVTKLQLMNEYKLLASYTTKTTSNANRNTNVRLSAQAINGREIKPGEVFSFNETTGQRTEAKGYKEAIAISGGQNVPDIGGGVCQTSGTLFNAVARADLEIVYRSPHAWPSTYVEKGMDATVNWPNLDFKFKNNKDTPVYVVSYYADRLITVEIYGKTLGSGITIDLASEVTKTIKPPSDIRYVNNSNLAPGTSKPTIEARTGYEVDTYKIWYENGQEIKRELFCHSSYKMYQRTVEYN